MSREPILSREPFIMIIRFWLSLILPKLIVWCDNAKAEKCFFEQSSIKYLGVIILENKVQIDEEKLSGVLEWPVLTKVKQVQAFLGFANFYCRFIENFAKMSKPLSDLTKKDCTWN